jgi:transcriptional regulator with XRE-family HTH domain
MTYNPKPLQRARIIQGWTYDALARRAKLSIGTVYNTIQGNSASLRSVNRLCEALSIPAERVWR